jgi:lysophospholipase L1-like esterase
MPVGDSITAGEHYTKPATGQRTGYRKHLYKYLTEEFYNVDFVGSQNHGNELDYDWNNEAYPGQKISAIAGKLKNALPAHRPDILLIHVGTNNMGGRQSPENAAKEVDAMLNMIKGMEGKKPTYVLLCKIINWFGGGHSNTTTFNTRVAEAVAKRKDDGFKIVLVDMEKGAGFNYSDHPDTGDMWGTKYPGVPYDVYHPNDSGNRKMANKFLDVLMSQVLVRER